MSLDTESRTAWISQGFERLLARVRNAPANVHFDVLIVGSGYGGAIAAATFAGRSKDGRPLRIGVLERGREYLPGAFPVGLGELPGHIRQEPTKEGLFDIRMGPEVVTVVANGVGGGSLINAGVMLAPRPIVFAHGWPAELSNASSWAGYVDRAAELLGARIDGRPNTIVDHPDGLPRKYLSFRRLAPRGTFTPAPVTVAMNDTVSSGNVRLNKCVRCGDCATGCNFGAKHSLDVGLLARAVQAGAEIFSGATVLHVARDGEGPWRVSTVHTNAQLRARDPEPVPILADRVVIAAGTLGSTEILQRSAAKGLAVAAGQLGRRCSTNGDMLVTDYATASPVNTVADEAVAPSQRGIGPTITGAVDLRSEAGVLIEELSVPAALRVAFTQVFAAVDTLQGLDRIDWSTHARGLPADDAYAVPASRIENSAVYAVMGDDGANGRIQLDCEPDAARDGIAKMHFQDVGEMPVFDAEVAVVTELAQETGGRTVANPVWKLLPPELAWLLADKRGPVTTVHPLGGCAMADNGAHGVVDHLGRVFSDGASNAIHEGLVVLDGSIVPTALATNPALTISALALRAAETLAERWGFVAGAPAAAEPALIRPVFRRTDVAASPSHTQVEVIERLVGPVCLKSRDGRASEYVAELTLRFDAKALSELTPAQSGDATLTVATTATDRAMRSAVRVYPRAAWEDLQTKWLPPRLREQMLGEMALFSAPVTGRLKVLERQPTWALGRILTAGAAWLLNRGLRDIYQAIVDGDGGPDMGFRIRSGLALASHAGEVRAFVYDLDIGRPDPGARLALDGDRVRGRKVFTYSRRGNPWRQLMEMTLDEFPGLAAEGGRTLKLDLLHLARIGVPLFRITEQRDGVAALADLMGFLGYVLRLTLGIHIWSFRAPDKDVDPARGPVVFKPPAKLKVPGGTVAAQLIPIPIRDERPALGTGTHTVHGNALVTRYPRAGTAKRPVVLLHGYSAGGTTFAHHAVEPNLASHLWASGRDVWVADMRTSPAHATATEAWSFEQIAANDVVAIIETAARTTGGKVDVVAHCMGTVVFSMAALMGKIDRLVDRVAFTQVGPLMVFTPANVFRGYVVQYLLNFLPDRYEFAPRNPTLADDLYDRILATLPYDEDEFDIENPSWPTRRTPWTRTRHRMDALYGRDFNVANMEPEMLRYIDEHFGRMSLKTVSTALYFARYAVMTDCRGRNGLVSRTRLLDHWPFPTFSMHGADNGLTHVSTVDRMQQILDDSGRVYLPPFINPGAGHQDSLIGTTRFATFERITRFLDADIRERPSAASPGKVAYPPWIGPIITEQRETTPALVVRIGSLPSHREAQAVVMLRIDLVGDRILRPDHKPWDLPYILDHLDAHDFRDIGAHRWSVFEATLPEHMPGHDPEHPGNALLVLIVYDESPFLRRRSIGHVSASSSSPTVIAFDPRGIRASVELTDVPPEEMPAIAAAVLHALDTDASRRTSGALPSAADAGHGRDIRTGFTDMDVDLMDGVIPYDPPRAPAAEPRPEGTRFTLASCQYPAGFFDELVAYRAYGRILERLTGDAATAPRFMLFVGDQVYIDPTAGLYDPAQKADRYRLPYEAWLREPTVRRVLRRVPSFMLLDDHEIDDNWEPLSDPDDPQNDDLRKDGVAAVAKFQRGLKPTADTFAVDGFGFYMLDTRTARMHRAVGVATTPQLVRPETMSRLMSWLTAQTGPRFVASPAMLLPRHRRAVQRDRSLDPANLSALHSDAWDGYPATLRDVLLHIARNRIPNVVFLSGDEHRACIATVDLQDAVGNHLTRLHSLHTAALYAPYPFANGSEADWVDAETIELTDTDGTLYRAVVNASAPPAGDGATFLFVRRTGADWLLDCEFGDGSVRTLTL